MTTTTSLTKITTASGTPIPSAVIKSDCLGRIHVSKEHREKLLDAFDASGMNGAQFAQHYGIKGTTFASWIQKRRRERNEYPGASAEPPGRLLDSLAVDMGTGVSDAFQAFFYVFFASDSRAQFSLPLKLTVFGKANYAIHSLR